MPDTDVLLDLLAFFYIYAFAGWCVEIAYHALTTGHLVNRGMLAGPVCPIYGAGMLLLICFTEPLQQSWGLTFVGAALICTALELAVGLVLRWLFHAQWWDYSREPFNIAGLICLRFSIAWGFGGTFLVKIVHPPVADVVALIPNLLLLVAVAAASAVMLTDLVITVSGILHLRQRHELLFDIEAQMRETSAAIGSDITAFTLDTQEKLEPVQQRLSLWQSETRADIDARRARLEARLAVLDERREELERSLEGDAARLRRDALARLDELRQRRQALLTKRTRIGDRFEKAFPNMKWLDKK